MSGSDKSHQTPPQLSQQPLQPSNVLETPKSNPSVDPELNSSTMMYGDENPNELQRIEDERKKQQEEQMLKLDADFKAELLVKEKSFERKKKELEQQLEELHKSHLNFTEEKEMELSMKRKDVESGIFKPTSSSTPQYGASVRPKTRGTPTTFDLNDKPDMFGKYHSRTSRSSRRDNSSDDEEDYYERSPQFRRKRSPSYDRYERRERYERSPDERYREDRRYSFRESSSQLPKLKLNTFDGNPLDWPEWSSMFVATVDSRHIPDSEKMSHLKTLLTGKAKAAVSGMGYSGRFYHAAWETLERKFGRPHVIIDAQLEHLRRATPVKKHDSPSLISFSTIVSSFVNVLKEYKQLGDLRSSSTLHMAIEKLPPNLREKWWFYVDDKDEDWPDLVMFEKWLAKMAFVHEGFSTYRDDRRPENRGNSSRDRRVSKGSNFTANTNENEKKGEQCPLADGNHKIWSCQLFKNMTVSDRYAAAKKQRLCFGCLKKGCSIKDCKVSACGINGCTKKHNRMLHSDQKPSKSSNEAEAETATLSSLDLRRSNEVTSFLQILPVSLQCDGKRVSTFAFLDSGATISFIDKSLQQKLQAKGKDVTLNVAGIHETKDMKTEKISFTVKGVQSPVFPIEAYVHPSIAVGNASYDYEELKRKFSHLSVLPNSSFNLMEIGIILGQDVYDLQRPVDYRKGQASEPFAVLTKLGWVVSGPMTGRSNGNVCHSASAEDVKMAENIQKWWDIEAYASKFNVKSQTKKEHEAEQMLQKSTVFTGERYEVGVLWSEPDPKLPVNYSAALGQLYSLERRFQRDSELKVMYQQTIDTDVEKGFVKILKESEVKGTPGKEWYLPHHPVLNPNKPGKVRRVCNAASKYKDVCLNDKLLAGPDLLHGLVGTIFRFREGPIAMTADIESMFLQVQVPDEDRSAFRFLWRKTTSEPVKILEYQRHVFGARSSPTCANYALKRVGVDNQDEFPIAAKAIATNFYMDDFIKSFQTPEEGVKIFKQLQPLLAKHGFELKKWICNNEQIQNVIPEELLSKSSTKRIEVDPTVEEPSVLGLQWTVTDDSLQVCRGTKKEVTEPITQRKVLSLVSSVFDPLGLFAPFNVEMRRLLKSIWSKCGQLWDEAIDAEAEAKFLKWKEQLPIVAETSIDRKYFREKVSQVDLHVFADASEDTMCAVAYFRAKQYDESKAELSFIIGKCRVAPMRHMSIPRLELQAAVMAVRLKDQIVKEHETKVNSCTFWSDSTTVIQWINSSHRKQQVFVANRVAEILDTTDVSQWKHVSGVNNPADIGTRLISIEELRQSEWFTGPAWLQESKEKWPKEVPLVLASDDDVHPSVFVSEATEPEPEVDWNRFSNFNRLVNSVAYVLRFIKRVRSTSILLSVEEREYAKRTIFKLVQQELFPNEYSALTKSQNISNSSKILQFTPFIDANGLIRAKGRLGKSDIDYDTKHPILLHWKHPAVELFLRSEHLRNFHEGTEYVRNVVQQNYWILGIRNALRSIKVKCVVCRKGNVQTIKPMMADLPEERLETIRPFTNVGVDYFGPFIVKIGRRQEKRWCCLFTCLAIRAVHLEIVPGLDSDSCLNAIARFIARRGKPKTILSDNGTNFVGAEREMREYLKDWNTENITQSLVQEGITWRFNPPASPHFGGVWERLVRSCKKAMYAVLGSRSVTEDVLSTTMCLVEQILNGRPITPVSSDVQDLEALTPNHFILGYNNVCLPCLPYASDFVDHRKLFRQTQAYADLIWNRFRKEYVPLLNNRSKWKQESKRAITTGDLVWIIEDSDKRGQYVLGRVVDVRTGSDGVVRSASIQTKDGVYVRPAVKLAPVLEQNSVFPEKENRAGDVGASDKKLN